MVFDIFMGMFGGRKERWREWEGELVLMMMAGLVDSGWTVTQNDTCGKAKSIVIKMSCYNMLP